MNTLREAVCAYLNMRRGLGFKLRDAGRALADFVSFLGEHHSTPATSPRHWRSPGRNDLRTLNRLTGLNG